MRLAPCQTQANGVRKGSTFIQLRTARSTCPPKTMSREAQIRGMAESRTSDMATPLWRKKSRLRGTR